MKTRIFLLLAAVMLLLAAMPAWAVRPYISANAVCTEQGFVINFTSTSWETFKVDGSNPQIDILFNDATVFTGAYALPGNAFSGSAAAPDGAGPGAVVVVTAKAIGFWGNGYEPGQSASVAVTLPAEPCGGADPGLGRFTGGGHQLRVGAARVTRGLTIHCDLLLSNNLEINWGGNHFHMTDHMTTVACTDDPEIIQAPPPAPVDTIIGVGDGRYNGVDGFTIEFTFVDAGEPGTADKAALKVYETANPANVKLNIPLQLITGGNVQAHYDQPHQ